MKDFRKSTVYQIYPKSFYDTKGKGKGDIKGITTKLDYLKSLGVDYVWSTPFFTSPQNDNGYDVADYYSIDPEYGTLEDLNELIKELDKREMGLMLDMVFNHTSTEHQWFKKALSGDEYYKEFYIFKKGKENNLPPTNWQSKFGGSAWEYVEEFDEYYLHLFDKTQADLNWNNPNVRKEIVKILEFWIKKGVKGFRFDVVNLISKPNKFEDDFEGDGRRFYTDGPNVHEFLKEMCDKSGLIEKGMLTVGEMSSTSIENCIKYSNPVEKELSMCFNFHHLKVDYKNQQKWELQEFDFVKLKKLFNDWQVGMQKNNGWSAVFWCNHDQPRAISRFGDDVKYHEKSAKMLATAIHMQRGTPYIYQGEEIGMTNAYFKDISEYRDVESINYYKILKDKGLTDEETYKVLQERSRDNSRTPMQWNSSENAGFTEGTPWINVISNYKEINVEKNLNDENSIFNYYKKLINLRKEKDIIAYGDYIPLFEDHKYVYSYERRYKEESLIVINNFYPVECTLDFNFDIEGYKCILSNYKCKDLINNLKILPYESIVFLKS